LVDSVGWAAVFIWGALVILAGATNFVSNFRWWDGWAIFFAGAGVIVLLEVVVRLIIPKYRQRVSMGLIFGFILMGLGLGGLVGWMWVWPLVLMVIAVVILRGDFKSDAKR
jgi:hypothetical protein